MNKNTERCNGSGSVDPRTETFSLLFERTTFKTLKLFIEKCLIPSDDFYEITISLKNELKDELSFLDDDEFDIVFRNEVINILKNYSFSI